MPTNHPDARHLRCFIATAEARSFRGAARRLGLGQATVTEHVQKLEAIVGFPVFDRVGRTIALTEQGRLLLPRARVAVRAMEEVSEGIEDAVESGVGRLAIGAIPTISPFLMPRVLTRLREEYPDCEITVYEDLTDALLDRLDDHTIEAAVLSPPVDHPRIEVEQLGSEQMLAVVPDSRETRSSDSITLREVRQMPRVSLSEAHCLGAQIESFCVSRGLKGGVVCHATQLSTVFEFVRLGMGVSLVPEMAAGHLPEGVRAKAFRREPPRRGIAIATKVGRSQSLLVDRFAALLQLEL